MSTRRDDDFTVYVQTRLAWLRRVGYLLCQDWQQADDLVQAAITSLCVHWRRASAMESIDGYARTILVRAFLSERRGGWARRVTLADRLPDRAGPVPDGELDHAPARLTEVTRAGWAAARVRSCGSADPGCRVRARGGRLGVPACRARGLLADWVPAARGGQRS